MSKKNKFRDTWCNQTELGKLFNMSAIKIGKELIRLELKDEKTKDATKKATDEGFAKLTPLKTGEVFFMWNKIKVKELLRKDNEPATQIDIYIREGENALKQMKKNDETDCEKFSYLIWDEFIDSVNKESRYEAIEKLITKGYDELEDQLKEYKK